jgi:outer membrane protein TolC
MAAADALAKGARDEVELQVTRAYFGLKAARTALETLDEIKDKLEPWKKKIADDLDSAKPKFDLYDGKRIEYALIQLGTLRADAERNVGVALDGLRILCGDDAEVDDAELDLTEVVDRPEEYYRHAALKNRPEVRALDEGVAGYRALANFQRSAMLPDLGLFLSLNYRQASTDIEDSQSAYQTHINYLGYGAGLVLREHFDMGQVARWRRSIADADALAAQRDLALSGIGLEIATAYHDLEESRKRAALYDKGQRMTRGWLRAVDEDLEGANPPRLIEAARAYFDQRLNYYRAINDVNYNIARLRRAAGVEVAR